MTVAAIWAPSAQAFTSAPLWKCRASALWVSLADNNRVEPIVANGNPNTSNNADPDRAQCVNAETGEENLATPLGIPTTAVSAQTASAVTSITPELGKAMDQRAGAAARVENLQLPLGGNTVILGARAAESAVIGSCQNGQVTLTGNSSVVDLTLGGQPIDLNPLAEALEDLLAPLGPLVDVKFNEQVREGNSLIVRAAHIKVLQSAAAAPVLDVVVAETKVSADEFTCDPTRQVPGLDFPRACPTGSVLDFSSGFCVIRATDRHGEIIVGRPYQGPSGGTVMALEDARRRFGNLECLRGSGPRFAIVGSDRRDRITGTNRKDRILGRGGNDSLDGGRGADCIDGGTSNDRIGGGIGSDRLIGGSGNDTVVGHLDKDKISGNNGNDHLNGGPGADTLDAGAGNDTINAVYGADRVKGGSGRDFVNVATQGPRATVDCGSGRDKVRLNQKERARVRNCEIRYVLQDEPKRR